MGSSFSEKTKPLALAAIIVVAIALVGGAIYLIHLATNSNTPQPVIQPPATPANNVAAGGSNNPPEAVATTKPTSQPAVADEKVAEKQLAAIRNQIEAAGHGRGTDQPDVVDAGFLYMAEHLHDDAVAKFDPLAGFTHYTVSAQDGGDIMLLVERTNGVVGGLNLKFDPNTGKIVGVKYWGQRQSNP